MATNSKIEWTESTWNPITGCTKFSLGCQNCYAERMAKRLYAMGHKNYRNCFRPTFHPHMLSKPLVWKKSRMIFVNSMSDTFHENISDKHIFDIFKVMNTARWHTFQVLTKRTERLKSIAKRVNWTPNIWLGVTIESNDYINRIDDLISCNASTRYISFEPLLSSIKNVNLENINWVIVGGESGPGARVMQKDWVIEIRNQCQSNNVPFFFKQWGGVNKKKSGRILENRIWDEMPISPNQRMNTDRHEGLPRQG